MQCLLTSMLNKAQKLKTHLFFVCSSSTKDKSANKHGAIAAPTSVSLSLNSAAGHNPHDVPERGYIGGTSPAGVPHSGTIKKRLVPLGDLAVKNNDGTGHTSA